MLLGDDILIGDSRLAERYLEVLHILGVEVSGAKTHKSRTFCEFAKRYLFLGEEVTPFPVSAVVDCKSTALMVSALSGLEEKGLVPSSGVPGAVRTFGIAVDFLSSKGLTTSKRGKPLSKSDAADLLVRRERNAISCYAASQYLQGRLSGRDFLLACSSRKSPECAWVRPRADSSPALGLPTPPRWMGLTDESPVAGSRLAVEIGELEEESIGRLLELSLADAVDESFTSPTGEPLSAVFVSISDFLFLEREQLPHLWTQYLEAIPLTGVGLQLEATLRGIGDVVEALRTGTAPVDYRELSRRLSNPLLLRSLGLEEQDLMAEGASRLGDKVRKQLQRVIEGGWYPPKEPLESRFAFPLSTCLMMGGRVDHLVPKAEPMEAVD